MILGLDRAELYVQRSFLVGGKEHHEFGGNRQHRIPGSFDRLLNREVFDSRQYFGFLLIFTYFAVPTHYQKRVLMIGIIGAIVLRTNMILVGCGQRTQPERQPRFEALAQAAASEQKLRRLEFLDGGERQKNCNALAADDLSCRADRCHFCSGFEPSHICDYQ